MGFNRRKIEADRKAKVDAQKAGRRTADPQVREDAERLKPAPDDMLQRWPVFGSIARARRTMTDR
jgi:hypothetical protein